MKFIVCWTLFHGLVPGGLAAWSGIEDATHKMNRLLKEEVAATKASNIVAIEGSETPLFFCEDQDCHSKLKVQQAEIVSDIQARHPNASVVVQVQKLANVVYMDLGDATVADGNNSHNKVLQKLHNIKGIKSTYSHQIFNHTLGATVEYIQGNQAHKKYCTTGKGVKVAVIDSGIDYTHEAFGGPGTIKAYEEAFGTYAGSKRNTKRDGLFPTETIYDGMDFMGDQISDFFLPLPDNDPIGDVGNHGTSVASNLVAVAPEIKILAVKVCVGPSCPDYAIVQGIEYAMDPNGDGDFDDRVDIINISLGWSAFPAYYSMLAFAIEQAFQLGTLTVVACGNEGNYPFTSGEMPSTPNSLAVGATKHPDFVIGGQQFVTSYSGRGPGSRFQLKPDISAPSNSAGAVAGTGNQYVSMLGTSFAAPIVAGAAALLKEKCSACSPFAIKAILMNNSQRNIADRTTKGTGETRQAPLSLVGSGEIRIADALAADFWAFSPDEGDVQPSISLGLIDVGNDIVVTRRIKMISLINRTETIQLSVEFRDDADEASGALEVILAETSITLSSCSEGTEVDVKFKINAANVPNNFLDSGSNAETVDKNEFDGHILLQSAKTSKSIHIPFYAILRKASNVTVTPMTLPNGSTPYESLIRVENSGAGVAQVDAYQLLGLSKDDPESKYGSSEGPPDIRAVGYRTIPVNAPNCSYVAEFVISLWENRRHITPLFLGVQFSDEFFEPISSLTSDPGNDFLSQKVMVANADGKACTGFYLDHSPGSANIIIRACGEQLGLKVNKSFNVDFASKYPQKGIDPYDIEYLQNLTIQYPQPVIFAHSYDIQPGETLNNLKVTNLNNDINTMPEGIILITNSYRNADSAGASVNHKEAIFLLRDGLESKNEEETADVLRFPQANLTQGPLCEWQSYDCSSLTEEPTISNAPSSTAMPTRLPSAVLTEYPSVTSFPSLSETGTYTFDPSCPPLQIPRLSVPTSTPSMGLSDPLVTSCGNTRWTLISIFVTALLSGVGYFAEI